jgi:hypothetical protein
MLEIAEFYRTRRLKKRFRSIILAAKHHKKYEDAKWIRYRYVPVGILSAVNAGKIQRSDAARWKMILCTRRGRYRIAGGGGRGVRYRYPRGGIVGTNDSVAYYNF